MKKIEAFKGFTSETFQFFDDLAENNYKEWFEEHRSVYENELLNPLKALVTALSPAMFNIDSQFELRPHRVLSRIYRDTRFSKDKTPYKTHLWMSFFIPVKEWFNCPGYFIELSSEGYFLGMGMYQPNKKTLESLRDRISYERDDFERETTKILDLGFEIGGDTYKRIQKNDLPEYFQQWMQRKAIYVFKKKPLGKEVFSADFVNVLQKDFESLAWLYNFMKDE